jgi:hypothetical protein
MRWLLAVVFTVVACSPMKESRPATLLLTLPESRMPLARPFLLQSMQPQVADGDLQLLNLGPGRLTIRKVRGMGEVEIVSSRAPLTQATVIRVEDASDVTLFQDQFARIRASFAPTPERPEARGAVTFVYVDEVGLEKEASLELWAASLRSSFAFPSVDLGAVPVGSTQTARCVVKNPTQRPLWIDLGLPPVDSSFRFESGKGSGELAPGGEYLLDVAFTPTEAKDYTTSVAVTLPAPRSLLLRGTGVVEPLTFPADLAFGAVRSTVRSSQVLTFRNHTSTAIELSELGFSTSTFGLASSVGSTVIIPQATRDTSNQKWEAGSASFSIVYLGGGTGSLSETFSFRTNLAPRTPRTVTLTATVEPN